MFLHSSLFGQAKILFLVNRSKVWKAYIIQVFYHMWGYYIDVLQAPLNQLLLGNNIYIQKIPSDKSLRLLVARTRLYQYTFYFHNSIATNRPNLENSLFYILILIYSIMLLKIKYKRIIQFILSQNKWNLELSIISTKMSPQRNQNKHRVL